MKEKKTDTNGGAKMKRPEFVTDEMLEDIDRLHDPIVVADHPNSKRCDRTTPTILFLTIKYTELNKERAQETLNFWTEG